MDWKKFAGPAILIGIAILIYVGMNVYVDAKYDEGDTVKDGDMIAICGTYLLMALSCLGSIVWFAFALGGKTQKTVFLAEVPSNSQNTPVALPYLTPDEFDQFAVINKNNNKKIEKNQNSRSIIKALINTLFGN